MIYIPDRYVFIVGGVGTHSVEAYDIKFNKALPESDLLYQRCEPSLCCVDNDYLYAFCGYNPKTSGFYNTIERYPSRKKLRSWEEIKYMMGTAPSFDSRFFGVIMFSETKILFIGGIDITKKYENEEKKHEDLSEKNYIFDVRANQLDLLQISGKNECPFAEKFFVPIDENSHAIIPLSEAPKVIVYSNGVFRTLKQQQDAEEQGNEGKVSEMENFNEESNVAGVNSDNDPKGPKIENKIGNKLDESNKEIRLNTETENVNNVNYT